MTLKWHSGRGPRESEDAWNRRNALALLPPESSRHCCACQGVCFHPGTPAYCADHHALRVVAHTPAKGNR